MKYSRCLRHSWSCFSVSSMIQINDYMESICPSKTLQRSPCHFLSLSLPFLVLNTVAVAQEGLRKKEDGRKIIHEDRLTDTTAPEH